MHQHRLEFSAAGDPRAERWERIRYFGFAAAVGALLLLNLTGVFRTAFGIDTAALLTIAAGYRTFYNAIHGLLERTISADLAICIAVVAALSVGEYLAAAEAMFIMLVGEGLEGYAAKRTSSAIRRFVEQMPRRARLVKDDGEEIEIDAARLSEGDTIAVRAGERVPADGVVAAGTSSLNESTITGEPLPRDKQPGDEVFSGTLNGNGLLRVRVTRAGNDTTLARVIRLVEQAREKRAPVERLADQYAKYFVPALLMAGAGTYYFTRDWMRTVAVLIVGCPCALILATPTAMVAAIGGLARRGILVRGGTVLQKAAEIDTVVFDKTGTVTEGRFEVVKIAAAGDRDETELLALAAAAEAGSDHVLARVIVEEARKRGVSAAAGVEQARILPGRGAEARHGERMLRVGNAAFLGEHGTAVPDAALEEADRLGATLVLVAEDKHFAGAIYLRDKIRAGVREATHGLEHLDITRQILLTGDRRKAAEAIARELEIGTVEAELLPEQKLNRVQALIAQGRQVAMAGDGVNDAPALAAAHVGIAVSGASDITAEAADVVYLGHSLERLPELFEVSRRAVATAWQNIIVFAGIVNVVAIGLGATGKLGPLGAAFTHQIASFLVMLNSLRLLSVPETTAAAGPRGAWAWAPARVKLWLARIEPVEWLRYLAEHRRDYYRPAVWAGAMMALASGFYTIGPDETGVIERFGRKVTPYRGPGLHYKLPWPVERLTRVTSQVRVVEVGFRSAAGSSTEPAAYEWNVRHQAGRFQRRPDESLLLSGDQNMTEVTATVHFRLKQPGDYLFRLADGEATVRAATEAALQGVLSSTALDQALTTDRRALEQRAREEIAERLRRYEAGVEVLAVKLLDVHPSLEVVDAYRAVAGAFEEKSRMINEAQAYANDIVPKARGEARARLETAQGYRTGRASRAAGDAARFTQAEAAYRTGPGITDTRLYLETMEQVLPGRKKLIVDANKGRRHLMLAEDGVEIGAAAAGAAAGTAEK